MALLEGEPFWSGFSPMPRSMEVEAGHARGDVRHGWHALHGHGSAGRHRGEAAEVDARLVRVRVGLGVRLGLGVRG